MNGLSLLQRTHTLNARRALAGIATLGAVAALSGCYVAPLQAVPTTGVQAPSPVSSLSTVPMRLTARLYPDNELAAAYGRVDGEVSDDGQGRGHFNVRLRDEWFSGEATRPTRSNAEGQANAAGNRGGYMSCRYRFTGVNVGTGSCRLNNGAVFTLHLGG